MERGVVDRVGMAFQLPALVEPGDLIQADRVMPAREVQPVGAEPDREHRLDPRPEHHQHEARPGVPEADGLIVAGRGDQIAVGVEGDRV